ncbi:MAG: hypothetical protein R3F34_07645 [Planctomycetota bacterium]
MEHVAALVLAASLVALQDRAPDPEQESAVRLVEGLVTEIAGFRGYGEQGEVAVALVDADEFREAVREQVLHNLPADFVERFPDAMRLLGLLPRSAEFDLLGTVTDSMTAGMIGLYVPDQRRMYVVRHPAQASSRLVGADVLREQILAHEVEHALQDRAFGIDDVMKGGRDTLDGRHARSALIEGDAVVTSTDRNLRRAGSSAAEYDGDIGDDVQNSLELASVIDAMSSGLMGDVEYNKFAYGRGASFVQRLVRRGGYEAVDAAFASPPLTTEQVLHPRKYDEAPDFPVGFAFELPVAARDAGWEVLLRERFGEFFTGVFLDGEDERAVVEGTVGWDGDLCAVLGAEDERAMVWISRWDSELDAGQFATVLASKLRIRDGDPTTETVSRGTGSRRKVLERRGARVILLAGAPRELEEALLDAARSAAPVLDPRDVSRGADDAAVTRAIEAELLAELDAQGLAFDGAHARVGELGLEFDLPADVWNATDGPIAAALAYFVRGESRTTFNVLALAAPGLTLEACLEQSRNEIRSLFEDAEITTAEIVARNGTRTVDFEWSAVANGRRVACHQRLYVRDGRQIVLTCTAVGAAPDDALAAEFVAILDSARFDGDAQDPTPADGSEEK